MLAPETLSRTLDIAEFPAGDIPAAAREMARFSLFDWIVVARAGAEQPVGRIVSDYVVREGGAPKSSIAGRFDRVPPRAAALANGAISHALDYDDTHFAHVGHPSVAVMPAALALGEARRASAANVLDAFLIGAEASIRVGLVLGRAHYERGFHQTATAGAFGATVAAARVLGLSREKTRQALSLVATRASGLKSQFGSMGKPFNAGIAASNGVEAAELAELGFLSCDDGLGGAQGFIDAHVDFADEAAAWGPPPGVFLFEDVKHKLHACCHGLHATLETIAEVKARAALAPDEIERLRIRVNPRWLRVCDVKAPRTGLEAKFSYAMTAAMALHGVDTAAEGAYTDELCQDGRLRAFWQRVEVAGDASLGDTAAAIVIERKGRGAVEAAHDLAVRTPPEVLGRGLRAKARALIGAEAADRLWTEVAALANRSAGDLGRLLAVAR